MRSATPPEVDRALLAQRIEDALPQTQCTRCGYADCAGYAQAVAAGQALINQCPPGGAQGIARLAGITGQPALALNPRHGIEAPRRLAWIDESACIGCTLCIRSCPTDAIVGCAKRMHSVIEARCTGCELCVPVCPVDCIRLDENASGGRTGWDAWSVEQADQARANHRARTLRLERASADEEGRRLDRPQREAAATTVEAAAAPAAASPAKRDLIGAALALARERRQRANSAIG